MIFAIVATVVLILVMTAWATHKTGDRMVKARHVTPLWGGGAALVIAVIGTVWYVLALRDYDQCVARAEARQGTRANATRLYNVIDAATGDPSFTHDEVIPGVPSLRDGLDIDTPPLDVQSCDALKP